MEFVDAFATRQYAKGDIISLSGEPEARLRFLVSGTVREYFSHEGKEMNTQFFVRPQFISDFHALVNHQSRKKYQECLSEVTLREMGSEIFFQFMDNYQCGKAFVDQIFQKLIAEKEDEAFEHFSLTPDELYQDLLQNKPEWLQEIPLRHIATYLRMTPETLSRIRKRS